MDSGGASHPHLDPAAQQVRQVIERLVRDGTATARSNGTSHSLFPTAVSTAEGERLRAWVTKEDARNTIETGLGYGVSALFVLEGMLTTGEGAVRHVVIDPNLTLKYNKFYIGLAKDGLPNNFVQFRPRRQHLIAEFKIPRLPSPRFHLGM